MADTSAAPHAATAPYIDIKIPARNRSYYNMSKIFCIGECALAFDLDGSAANIGLFGRIAQAAAILGRQGAPVSILSEAAADPVGQAAVDTLTEAGVNTAGIDRFTDGTTPVIIRMGTRPIRYENYGDECFDIVWPNITRGDIVVFGEFYALDGRMRARMVPLLDSAAERGAVMIYLPGFMPSQTPRITRVMPAILDNLERAHIVITDTEALTTIFNNPDGRACYEQHIRYSAPVMVHVDGAAATIFGPGVHASADNTADISAITAHVAQTIAARHIAADSIIGMSREDALSLVTPR